VPQSQSIDTTRLVTVIGLTSIGFGLFDYLMADRLAAKVGMDHGDIFRAAGAREIVTGGAAVAFPVSRLPIIARIVGDVADTAILSAVAAKPDNSRRWAALLGVGIVAAVSAVDILAARRQRAAS
jgi:hypothetical protein